MNINEKTAVKIREAREQKGYTQQHMAASLDISKNSYSLIELGKTKIYIELLFKICELLDVSVEYVLNLKGNSIQNNDNSFVITQNNHGTLQFTLSEEMLSAIQNQKKK